MSVHPLSESPSRQRYLDAEILNKMMFGDDWASFTSEERAYRYTSLCEALGLDARSKPIMFVRTAEGRTIPYIPAATSYKLAQLHQASTRITGSYRTRSTVETTVEASTPDGRRVERKGAIDIERLAGQKRADAYMWSETKASRRAILALLGIGLLDESEVVDMDGAVPAILGDRGDLTAAELASELEAQPRTSSSATADQVRLYRNLVSRLGWSNDEEQVILARFGVTRPEDIDRHEAFTRLKEAVSDPQTLMQIRSEISGTPDEA